MFDPIKIKPVLLHMSVTIPFSIHVRSNKNKNRLIKYERYHSVGVVFHFRLELSFANGLGLLSNYYNFTYFYIFVHMIKLARVKRAQVIPKQ